jgi:RNA polymerase sigma-70 factor (ECF subfamily)
MVDTDRALMARVAGRDHQAFTRLAERYAPRLLAVAGRLLGSRADAEDAVQRALLQCYVGAAGYRAEWALSTWLYRILTNVCVDEIRRREVRAAHAREVTALPARLPRPDAEAAGRVDLARALGRVPREARVLLALCYVDGLSYAELARIRGISVNTVKSQLLRGKAILRAALDEGPQDGGGRAGPGSGPGRSGRRARGRA